MTHQGTESKAGIASTHESGAERARESDVLNSSDATDEKQDVLNRVREALNASDPICPAAAPRTHAAPPPVLAKSFSGTAFVTIEAAAPRLDTQPPALRARCRRASRRVGDAVVAKLGGGIVAFKFGRSWRIRFPAE